MKYLQTYKQLKEKVLEYMSPKHITVIEKAYRYSKKAHHGQYRKSGNLFITHPVSVAFILAQLEQDVSTICAGLLHDTIEDSDTSREDIEKAFGEDIANLVSGVTHLGKIYFGSKEEQQADNFRRMFLAMAKDIRVVIIKLSDRLHNMRTLKYLSSEKQKRIASETLDIFAPLAHRLGIGDIKWELEDLAFYFLNRKEFQRVKKFVSSRRDEREGYISSLVKEINTLCSKASLKPTVMGRPKHFFSIYRKMRDYDLSFEDLYDTIGLRVIVQDIKECYEVLGLIHSSYKPVIGRFKDYIAMPKSNMYQSLHTTVIGPKGVPVEIQIRTEGMHDVSEKGVASHWRYKEGVSRHKTKYDGDLSWIRNIIDHQKESIQPKEFFQNLKLDLFIDEVFVFTPKGDVMVFPKGATAVDFAYRIHTEIGHRLNGAKVNGHIVNLNYQLQNGDRLEILTHKRENPNDGWLHFVKTNHARQNIKQWFRKQNTYKNIEKGRKILERQLLFRGYVLKDVFTSKVLKKLKTGFTLSKWESVYLLVSQGELLAPELVQQIDKFFKRDVPVEAIETLVSLPRKSKKKGKQDVIRVLGEDNIEVHLAKCCRPLPGDDILGFITVVKGVTIHRQDCSHIVSLEKKDRNRLVDVEWNLEKKENYYPVTFSIEAFDRRGLLQDIISILGDLRCNIVGVNTKRKHDTAKVRLLLAVEVKNRDQVSKIREVLLGVSDVLGVKRLMGGWSGE